MTTARSASRATVAALVLFGLAAPWVMGQCGAWSGAFEAPVGLNGAVYCMTPWDPDGPGPMPTQLIVGGAFTTAGGATVNHIARWDGAAWHAMGTGMSGGAFPAVYALTTWDPDGDGPAHAQVVAAGGFVSAGGATVNYVARWDGHQWHGLGSGLNADTTALTTWDPDGDGPLPRELVAGGNFVMAGSTSANRIARWDGTQWFRLSNGMSDTVYGLTTWDPDGPGPMNAVLVASGQFTTAGNQPAQRIARWNGTSWQPIGDGLDALVLTVASWDPDGDGPELPQLVAGGMFSQAGTAAASRIARWDGAAWHAMGSGMSGEPLADVYALRSWDPDGPGVSPPRLVAGGLFTAAGGTPANYVAQWNGSEWSNFGDGMSGGGFVDVLALTEWDADGAGPLSGQLVAGGEFQVAGTAAARNIALWGSQLPEITEQPSGGSVPVGAQVSLSAEGTHGPLDYRWHKGGSPLDDGPTGAGSTLAGATTSKLLISDARPSDSGVYTLVIANACGGAVSEGASLVVNAPPSCAADANGDGVVNAADLSVLLSQFGQSATPGTGADFNGDGVVNAADLSVLLGRFGVVC